MSEGCIPIWWGRDEDIHSIPESYQALVFVEEFCVFLEGVEWILGFSVEKRTLPIVSFVCGSAMGVSGRDEVGMVGGIDSTDATLFVLTILSACPCRELT